MDIFFDPGYSTMWSALGALAQGLASIMAIAALIYSMTTFKKTLQISNYTELDKMYFDLLKTALEKPHLNNPIAIHSDDQKIEYDIYAFMVWNFLEAVYDRSQQDKHLRDTWYPIVDAENRKHREWFDHPENKHKFKNRFHEFIRNTGFK